MTPVTASLTVVARAALGRLCAHGIDSSNIFPAKAVTYALFFRRLT
jgi:hypothetical protein